MEEFIRKDKVFKKISADLKQKSRARRQRGASVQLIQYTDPNKACGSSLDSRDIKADIKSNRKMLKDSLLTEINLDNPAFLLLLEQVDLYS